MHNFGVNGKSKSIGRSIGNKILTNKREHKKLLAKRIGGVKKAQIAAIVKPIWATEIGFLMRCF